ncbi:hypothetical protein J6590_057372 [Homalodisca vitripennis]|nr:hypothetical protein J6590_057372 [Homalodisca vitripennis]
MQNYIYKQRNYEKAEERGKEPNKNTKIEYVVKLGVREESVESEKSGRERRERTREGEQCQENVGQRCSAKTRNR